MCYEPGEVPSLPERRQDNTHSHVYGAYTLAGLLVVAVPETVPERKKHLRHCDVSVATDGSGLYFDIQEAADSMPADCKATVLVGEGKWRKPSITGGRNIRLVMREGAELAD